VAGFHSGGEKCRYLICAILSKVFCTIQEYQESDGHTLLNCMIESSLTKCILTECISQLYIDHNMIFQSFQCMSDV
jgi:hypothetical protein